jgi:transcriptional regulator with XRE-family HTH domain
MTLAQRVRDYRYSKGWGPDELASRAAISRTALYQIESGKTELPRAGTLRRIAMALEVSMETLLGHDGSKPPGMPNGPQQVVRGRALSAEWYPAEGAALTAHAPRPHSKFDANDGARFAVEHVAPHENGMMSRERDLSVKLHELLASPFGEAVARILEETYRLLPQARVVNG